MGIRGWAWNRCWLLLPLVVWTAVEGVSWGAESVDVSSLDLSKMTSGWGQAQASKSLAGEPLRLRGREFASGVATHAPSKMRINLAGQGDRFTSVVGVDDSADGNGGVRFQVVADGEVVWESGRLSGTAEPEALDVDVRGVKVLELRVADGGDGAGYDHADWANAKVSVAGSTDSIEAIEPYEVIRIGGDAFPLAFIVGDDGRLYQAALGEAVENATPPRTAEAYPQGGYGYVFEPALQVVHADGDRSTSLAYVAHRTESIDAATDLVEIDLRDTVFPLDVTLSFRVHRASGAGDAGVVEQWVTITNGEDGPITLERMASASLVLPAEQTTLMHFHGDWNDEMNPVVEKLTPGMKVVDSKLGVRAHQLVSPSFIVGLDGEPAENTGRVLGGTLAWSGSFQAAFDHTGKQVRALCGVNPYASEYQIAAGESFVTPTMIWAWSDQGLGKMSRSLHRWAREHGLREGDTPRDTLLNNWEATGFDFDAERITNLFGPAKEMGIELFLLDDGWFGKMHPRLSDNAGLGDWEPNRERFPKGMAPVAEAAIDRGLRFGIWIEPEMVNPRSELYERHPEWVIRQPRREPELQRNQMILDLTRPEVFDFEWGVIERTLGVEGVTCAKWDANRYVTQPGSSYLPAERQMHLWIDYTRQLYKLMAQTAEAFPKTELMLCSGGGGRVDYGALRYFHEFWPSDNTDAVRRVTMQWDYSYFFPSIAMSSHVSRMGERPLHFATAVAMSAKYGMDIDVAELTDEEMTICRQAIAAYKSIREVVQLGDLYRVESPHDSSRCVIDFVAEDGKRAAAFVFQLKKDEPRPVKLMGLDPKTAYSVHEVHPAPGRPVLADDGATKTGAELMEVGFATATADAVQATMVELIAIE
ncbi:alpha-galactosidase [Botrimarina mediterranea]|uniref:alpha-galactosidase n=1 Tax=Botrimarina mediterranea TaxID=2528022 RepID=A0A518KCS1_9BACT|nr:alpha-galactosidase [Botrimarina mediterranea]QDV75587.1 Alpha-galactosidase [Botrimarina mediterranea]